MFSTVKRSVGPSRIAAWNAVTAFKRDQVQGTTTPNENPPPSEHASSTEASTYRRAASVGVPLPGPILRQDEIWRSDIRYQSAAGFPTGGVYHRPHCHSGNDAAQPSLQSRLQLLHAAQQDAEDGLEKEQVYKQTQDGNTDSKMSPMHTTIDSKMRMNHPMTVTNISDGGAGAAVEVPLLGSAYDQVSHPNVGINTMGAEFNRSFDLEGPVINMEAFLKDLNEELCPSEMPVAAAAFLPPYFKPLPLQQQQQQEQQDFQNLDITLGLSGLDLSASFVGGGSGSEISPMSSNGDLMTRIDNGFNAWTSQETCNGLQSLEAAKTMQHFNALSFDAMHQAAVLHLLHVGPVPDMTIFYLFRKVHHEEHAERALEVLLSDRECRNRYGLTTPYSEIASAAIFNALNRTGGEDFVIAAAEQAMELGLTLSRSNMYHLMKQYSVQGKVEHVEKLFRALEQAGKSWNSNCVVIMMLAYFNRGKFEEADQLRKELKARGIKISERMEKRLDALLSGDERWRWEDQVYYRARKPAHNPSPPPGFAPLPQNESWQHGNYLPSYSRGFIYPSDGMLGNPYTHLSRGIHAQARISEAEVAEGAFVLRDLPTPTLMDAVAEPRLHLNILRAAGFNDLYQVLEAFVKKEGPVENVCISFLFRKVEMKGEAVKAMAFLEEERAARSNAGISEEYNETTCSRIFAALFRTGVPDLAFACAKNASETGLVLSGKALHELLKSFATRNEVEKVEQIWELVKINSKPSSRIVYSIFRTYFDNGMMDRASKFRDEIQSIGIKLSASATRNIDDVLSGIKRWVKDPHAGEF